MPQLPIGTVTFLMTDLEGSSRLWEKHPNAMRAAVVRHHEIIHEAIGKHGGLRPSDQGEGDSIVGAFSRATDAVGCALDIQLGLRLEPWPEGISLSVRIALHTGEAELRDEANYATPTLHRAARLRAIAHGGQVLVSQSTLDLVREKPPAGAYFRDLGEHRLKDLAYPEHVFQLIHPELPDAFPPLRSLEQLPNNLPLQLTSFIGREQEIAEVKKLVEGSRLVTLTGAAGCGKTRLVLQVAAEQLDEYRDGVWFVDLSPLSEAEAVTGTVTAALGVKEQPGRLLLDSLREDLKGKETLLLLDNCEHVLGEVAPLASQLLQFSPFLRILATSREALAVPGETPWRVPSLRIPDPDSPPPPTSLGEFEAARLFLDRAWTISPDLSLTEDDAAAIAQICHRLDGIPLAIELAAARTQVLTFRQIASKLDDQFRLLTGGSRTALERQQTMRAAVEWSYKLLNEQERVLLRRLSVFSGGFGLEAAEEICGFDPLDPSNVLDVLSALVQKSLVIVSREGQAARYRLLETIRQFAREKLSETDEGIDLRTRHRDWFMALAEEAEPALFGREQAGWVERLEDELDNIRAAIEWSSGSGGSEQVLRIAAALMRLWTLRHPLEGISLLEMGLQGDAPVSLLVRARALWSLSFLYMTFGDRAVAREMAGEALEAARAAGDRSVVSRSLNVVGNVVVAEGDYEAGKVHYEEALALAQEIGDTRGAAALVGNLGYIAGYQGHVVEAKTRLEEALRMSEQVGDTLNIGMALLGLGTMHAIRAQFGTARRYFEDCLSTFRSLETPGAVMPTTSLAELEINAGDYERARYWCQESIALVEGLKEALARFMLAQAKGLMAYLNEDYERSKARFQEAAAEAEEMGQRENASRCLLGAGFASEAMGDLASARTSFEAALAEEQKGRRLPGTIPLLNAIGRTASALGDFAAATRSLKEALEISLRIGDPIGAATALEGMAGIVVRTGDSGLAARLFGMAASVRESVGSKPWPHLKPRIEEEIALARETMGTESFERAREGGRALSFEAAAEEALEAIADRAQPSASE